MSSSTAKAGDTNNSPSPFMQAMSPDERKAHMRRLGQSSAAGRLTLSADEKQALGEAYRLLERIYRRHEAKLDTAIESEASK